MEAPPKRSLFAKVHPLASLIAQLDLPQVFPASWEARAAERLEAAVAAFRPPLLRVSLDLDPPGQRPLPLPMFWSEPASFRDFTASAAPTLLRVSLDLDPPGQRPLPLPMF